MSFRVNRNLGPFNSGAQTIFALKQWLCTSHGGTKFWTVVASGDGLAAFSAVGDIITHNGTLAGGLDNLNAWFVMRDPDSNRWMVFHRGAASYQWNIWYQLTAFDLTGCNASTPPAGGPNPNRKAVPAGRTNPSTIFTTSGSWYTHICCEGDTPDGNVYPFWALSRLTGAGTFCNLLLMDCTIDSLSPAADSDKAVLFAASVALTDQRLAYGNQNWLNGFMRYGEANSEWSWLSLLKYGDGTSTILPGGLGTSPEDGKYPVLPCFVARIGGVTNGPKGQSNLFRWVSSSLGFGDVVYDGTDYFLVADQIMLRGWPDSTGPLI